MREKAFMLGCVGALLLCSGSVNAELFRWTDAEGTLHFTDNSSRAPVIARVRTALAPKAPAPRPTIQIVAPDAYQLVAVPPGSANVRVARFGRLLRVNVRLNGKLDVPFLIDTGADDLVIPSRVAQQLGLLSAGNAQMVTVTTANGSVPMAAVQLDSVALGSSRVVDLRAVVNPKLEFGLLGLSFLRHFKYTVDMERGLLILERRPQS